MLVPVYVNFIKSDPAVKSGSKIRVLNVAHTGSQYLVLKTSKYGTGTGTVPVFTVLPVTSIFNFNNEIYNA